MVQFVPLKLNVDTSDANNVRRNFPIQGNRLPFVYVIRADNKKIYGASGGLPGDQLPAMMREALRQAGRILTPAQEKVLSEATVVANTALEAGDLYRASTSLQTSIKSGLLGTNAGFSESSIQATKLLADLSQRGTEDLKSAQLMLDSEETQIQSLFTLLLGQRIYYFDMVLQNEYRKAAKIIDSDAEFTSLMKQAREIEKAVLIQYARGGETKAVHALTRLALLSDTNSTRQFILGKLRQIEGSNFELPDFNPYVIRKWTDDSGSFSINAKVLSVSATMVILENENDEQISVPIIRLGKSERELLKLIQP
ncbi:MAG: hypothetical protein CMJ76_08250 [Planctomycetaceae bacterium]|nr:hypothetical protein [Planctomycetaceae bacterium]